MNQKRVAFHTLGCKLNFAETSTLARMFTDNGYKKVKFTEEADVYIINTCSVTSIADKKSRYEISRAVRKSPKAIVAVVGCYSQLKSTEIAKIDGVDIILGTNDKFKIFDFIDDFQKSHKQQIHSCDEKQLNEFYSSYSSGDRTRSFLKIQDGCDYHCSYCTVPLARGNSRNHSIEHVLADVREIAAQGFKEIILTGLNLGDFGKSTNESFFQLVQQLENVEGIERFRISSIEPNLITDEIIEFVSKSKKFLPHFHIPLQSGSDKILGLMKRRYHTTLFAQRIKKIKSLMPDAFIGIDVIVGFPGENDDDFQSEYDLLSSLDIAFLHIFPYSERPNTPAASLPDKVKDQKINERIKKLHELSDNKHKEFITQNIGTVKKVLFEHLKSDTKMFGFTENYIKVEHAWDEIQINKVVKAKLIEILPNSNVKCEIVD